MSIFERQLVTIYSNDISYVPGTKKPLSEYTLLSEHVPCTITSITTNANKTITLFILKRHLDKVGALPRRGYKIVLEETDALSPNIIYRVIDEPVWSGGVRHHIEVTLEEFV